jgi:hypothetical protein
MRPRSLRVVLTMIYNLNPTCALHDRGVTKCVPLNVDRRLYNETALVILTTVNLTVKDTFLPGSGLDAAVSGLCEGP